MIYLSTFALAIQQKGSLAQWFRASALQAEGRGFESLSSHDRDHPKQDGFLCREHSSVGLERLLDKQEVCGSNPHVPTNENQTVAEMQLSFFICAVFVVYHRF